MTQFANLFHWLKPFFSQPASYGKKNGMWYASPGNQGWGAKSLSRKASVVEADVAPTAATSTLKPSAGRVIRIINHLDHSVQVSSMLFINTNNSNPQLSMYEYSVIYHKSKLKKVPYLGPSKTNEMRIVHTLYLCPVSTPPHHSLPTHRPILDQKLTQKHTQIHVQSKRTFFPPILIIYDKV